MRRSGALALSSVLLLAGCASLPMEGPVSTADPQRSQDTGFEVIVPGPQADETPREIVDGFLLASRFGTDPLDVARDFLTADAAESWDPSASVYIYSSAKDPTVTEGDDGKISVTVEPLAMLDEAGNYTALVDTTYTIDFSLVAGASGDWRIARLDDGVMISDLTFNQTYVAAPLQFVSSDEAALVPELRWFTQSDAATLVVEALLEGPSGWLASGVSTAFPRGTTIGPSGVRVDGSVVYVDLSAEALEMEPEDVPVMRAQLHQSLASLTDITVVDVTVMGEPLENSDPMREFRVAQSVSSPYMMQGDVLVRWTNSDLEIVDDSEEFQLSQPTNPAVPYSESSAPIVVVAGGNSLRTVATETVESVTLYEGENLVAPSYDSNDWVWTTPAISDGTLIAISGSVNTRFVSAPWLDGRTVLAVRVSPGGDRVAVVSRSDGVDSLSVAVVLRDLSGAPMAVGDPFEVVPMLTSINDITWVDQTTVGVLGAESESSSQLLYLASVGGPARERSTPVFAESLTSARSERSILMVTDEGVLFQRTGSGWLSLLSGVSDPAYSG